ncbi:MAG TPA: FGGY-family carbohydrate kinase [Acidimicrobiales bacterium]
MSSLFLGIDIGTSAVRVALIDDTSRVVRVASADYLTTTFEGGYAEQDPNDWITALRRALSAVDIAEYRPRAIGLCGQTPTLVFVDAEGQSCRPSLTWQDARATREASILESRLGDPETLIGTRLPWSASNMPAKLLWLTQHEPDLVGRTRYVLQPKDFVGMALTGQAISDGWSSKGLCNVLDGLPAIDVLKECGWAPQVCPPIDLAWHSRGVVSPSAAATFDLVAGTPVTVGWSDALAEMLAAGVFARSSAFMFTGTSSIVGAVVEDHHVRAGGLFNVPTTCAPSALLYGPTQAGGAALTWTAELLGCSVDDLVALAGTATESPTFVPYLYGERAPLWDSEVRALFAGVSRHHGRAEIARAAVVGVVSAAKNLLDMVASASNRPISGVEIAGRGVGQASWERFAAEGLGLNARFHHDTDLSVRGAAMLAMALDGVDVVEASARLIDDTHEIDATAHSESVAYAELERYRRATDLALQWRTFSHSTKETK